MDAHRVDVLDRADDHDVVVVIAHHLELELAPSDHRLVEQHLTDRRGLDPAGGDRPQLVDRARDAASAPAERERRANDAGQAEVGQRVERLCDRRRDRALGHRQAGAFHRLAEQVAILGTGDRVVVGADQLDAELSQRPVLVQRLRQIQRRLPAKRRQQRVGALALDHLADRARQQRLDVGRVGELGVGHDRGRVRVDEHDLVALLAQDLARLDAGVVELGRLADHDRARAEDQDPLDVIASRHSRSPRGPAARPRPRCARGSGRRGRGCRAARDLPRGGTGRFHRARRAARVPRPCGRRGSRG